jgi:Lytic transglycolase
VPIQESVDDSAFRRRDLRRTGFRRNFIRRGCSIRNRFRVRLCGRENRERRARSPGWAYGGASHSAFGTRVRVTNKSNGLSVLVRINDRGPFVRGRVIDLTPAAARALGFSGLAHVTLQAS